MSTAQPGILADVPRAARHLLFQLTPKADARSVLESLRDYAPGAADGALVVGLGASLVQALGAGVAGLHELSPLEGPGASVPVTPAAAWCWLRGQDRGEIVDATHALASAVKPGLVLTQVIDTFQYRDNRDLSGYIDGTENPTGDAAEGAALAPDKSSFAVLQQWVHDLGSFRSNSEAERDLIIGRRVVDNEEIDDAPASAHVKRTAQEDFDPPAFMLRRSMPWTDGMREGLAFLAFGCTLDAFEQQMRRMVGLDDGVVDALFTFTRPETGAAFWCPALTNGSLDLSAIGL